MAAAGMRSDRLVFSAAVGTITPTGRAATIHDRWHLGSITKPMTATLIARLIEEGRLGWRDRVLDTIPCPGALPAYRDATLTDLLSHRAGLRENIPLELFDHFRVDRRPLPRQRLDWSCRALMQLAVDAGPGHFSYSNNGYIIAGAMAETRTGRPWEWLIRQKLFQPLGLASAGFGPPETGPAGHEKGPGGGARPVPRDWRGDNPPALGPAGTVHMTVLDLVRFGNEHAKMESGRSTLLRAETARILHEAGGEDYALGWNRQTLKGRPLLLHEGSNTSWFALLMVAPQDGWSVAVVTNGGRALGGEGATLSVAGKLTRLIA
jgi:D-alanyl-D-alanine carboxypeptidase